MKIGPASYLAEFVGAFVFILSILTSDGNPFIVGGMLALVILLIGGVSGGHVNPAVSLAFFMKGALTPVELGAYIFAQLAGGAGAFYASKML